jgi:hypothetical protein
MTREPRPDTLKVSPTKGVQRFGVKGKLAPRYIGPYEVTEECGLVAYCIQLPERFSAVHNVFHVTQLKKGMPVPENEVITEVFGCEVILGSSFWM